MRNDLISREALKKKIMECMTVWNEHSDYGQGRLRSYEWVINLIDNAPTVEYPFYQEAYQTGYEEAKKELESPVVQVSMKDLTAEEKQRFFNDWKNVPLQVIEERPQGEWENDSDNLPICNKCGEIALQRIFVKVPHLIQDVRMVRSNYCPNCGADMRGKNEK